MLELGLGVDAVRFLKECLGRASGILPSEKGGPQMEVADKYFYSGARGEGE